MNGARDTVAIAAAPPAAQAFRRLAWLGAATVALVLATPFAFWHGGDNAYMGFAIATGLVAAAATGVAERCDSARALWLIVAVALALRIVLIAIDPLLSSDIFRYVWDGKVQAAGINPYRYAPADPALASLRDAAVYPNIFRADYAVTIYPPVAQMFFLLVTRFGENVVTMKLALVLAEGITATTIVLLLRKLGRPATRLVAYAWHPLPLWEIANNGHIDGLMTALMMLGICLALFGRPVRGAVAVALGALAKPFAIVALPALWRPWDWKVPLAALVTIIACYAPYLSVGWGVFGFFTTYVHEEKFDTGGYVWPLAVWRALAGVLPHDVIVYDLAAVLVLGALALRAAFRAPKAADTVLADINRLLLAFLFLLSPNFPWYFLIATPFTALVGGAPVWALTIGAAMLQEEATWDPYVPLLIRKTIHFLPFLVACAYVIWRHRRTIEPVRVAQ